MLRVLILINMHTNIINHAKQNLEMTFKVKSQDYNAVVPLCIALSQGRLF